MMQTKLNTCYDLRNSDVVSFVDVVVIGEQSLYLNWNIVDNLFDWQNLTTGADAKRISDD